MWAELAWAELVLGRVVRNSFDVYATVGGDILCSDLDHHEMMREC